MKKTRMSGRAKIMVIGVAAIAVLLGGGGAAFAASTGSSAPSAPAATTLTPVPGNPQPVNVQPGVATDLGPVTGADVGGTTAAK